MNEFNYPTGSKRSTRGTRGRGARTASSNPGVERTSPGTSPPPPPPPFSNPPASNEVSSGEVSQERAARPVSYADQYPTTSKENAMRCSNKTTTGLSLLGGAGLGAALMYLMDPEQGHERRTHLGEKAGYAKDATAAALAAAMEVAREKGQSASEALAEKLADLGSAGAETAGHLFDRASETGHRIGKTSRRYTDSARESIGSPRSWLGREEQRSYVPSTGSALGAVACLAAGFGLMYLMDPQQGRRRRHVARDKTMKWLREIGDMSRRTGRHWANKSRGYAHETMSAARSVTGGMTGGEGFGRSLAERIRERIGSLGRGKSVNVDCDDCGRVTLGGDCTPDEVAILVAEVQSVPGVDSIDNRMNVGAGAGLGQ